MRPAETAITRLLRSHAFILILIILAGISAFVHMPDGMSNVTDGIDRGLLFESPGHWIADPARSRWWALSLNLLVIGVMTIINRRYNLLRTMTWLFGGLFAVMEAASPETLRLFTGGQLGALTLLWCLWLMFSTYHRRRLTKRVFMTFCLLSAGSMVQYGFVVFTGVMLSGCAQMRIFTLRTVTAALLGIITPWWIAFGMGFASFSQLHLPELSNPFAAMDTTGLLQVYLPVGVTLLAGIVCGMANLIKIISFNARMRAYHGLLSVTSVVAGIMAVVDFTNIEFYIPLLNACVALQAAHFFRINLQRRGYIMILLLIAAYSGIWLWKLMI